MSAQPQSPHPFTTRPAATFERMEGRMLFSSVAFDALERYPAGMNPGPVVSADFNADGIRDLAVAGNLHALLPVERDGVRVLLGKGDGSFAEPTEPVPAGEHVVALSVGDFNRDGRPDVAAVDRAWSGYSAVYVLLGKGGGLLAPARPLFSGAGSNDVAVADYNGDRIPDLMVANEEPWAPPWTDQPDVPGAALLLGRGDGTFGGPLRVPAERGQRFVEAADANGDGRADAVFAQTFESPTLAEPHASAVFAALNAGGGLFKVTEGVRFAGSVAGLTLDRTPANVSRTAADATTDPAILPRGGVQAAVAINYYRSSSDAADQRFASGSAVGVLRGGWDGSFAGPVLYKSALPHLTDIASGDLDGDGRADLMTAGLNPFTFAPADVGGVQPFRNTGGDIVTSTAAGGFTPGEVVTFRGHPQALALGHFNRDHLTDAVVTLPREGSAGVLLNATKTLNARGVRVMATAGVALRDQPVAQFSVTGARPEATAFKARINWGDRTLPTAGKVVPNRDGTFTVLGSHLYRRPGVYRVTVTVAWPEAGLSRTAASWAYVRSPANTARPVTPVASLMEAGVL